MKFYRTIISIATIPQADKIKPKYTFTQLRSGFKKEKKKAQGSNRRAACSVRLSPHDGLGGTIAPGVQRPVWDARITIIRQRAYGRTVRVLRFIRLNQIHVTYIIRSKTQLFKRVKYSRYAYNTITCIRVNNKRLS